MAGGLPPEIPLFIDLTPYLQAIMFVVDVLEWLGIIPDPLDLLFSLFIGRPREQATVQVIQRLYTSPNAAARLWGIELSRLLTEDDIVISSGGGAQTILGAINQQFENNLISQGVSAARAGEIAVNAVSRAAQAGEQLEPELQQPVPSSFTITGPQSVLDAYNTGLQQGTALGKVGTTLTNYAERYAYQHAPFSALAQIGFTQTPPATQPTPPPGPVDGPAPQPNPPQPNPPTPPGQQIPPCPPFTALPDCLPAPGAVDPDLDEVGQGFSGLAYWMQILAIYAMNIFSGMSGGSTNADPVTCNQLGGFFDRLTAAISLLIAPLNAIASALSSPPVAVEPAPPVTPPPPVVPPTEPTPPTDNCVCDALNAPIPPQPDYQAIVRAAAQFLVANYALDAAAAQIIETPAPTP